MILRYFFNLDERGVERGILECRWNGRMVRGRLYLFFPGACISYAYVTELKSACCFPQHWEFFTFLSISSFLTSAEQGQKIAYSITVPETKDEASLSGFCHREGGRWDGAPSLFRVQNPMDDRKTTLVRGAGEPCSLRPGALRLSGAGHQAFFGPRHPWEGRDRVWGTAGSSTPSTLWLWGGET